jgi:uncharacterized protein involved in exopolysaccharide biosynthesis
MTFAVGDNVGEVDTYALVSRLWQRRWMLVASTLLGAGTATVGSLYISDTYRSQALVQARQERGISGATAALTAQFGGLASLAGHRLGDGGEKAVALATLQSRTLIEKFISDNGLLPKLYSSAWDPESKKWRRSEPTDSPTTWEAYNYFVRSILRISDDKKSGLTTVAIEWTDPEEAKEWVTELLARTNAHLKAVAVHEAESNLAYLEQQSRNTSQVELRQAVYALVETELKKLMIARGSEEFALKTIDAATVPRKKVHPNRPLFFLVGTIGGLLLGVVLALLSDAISRQKS